MCCWLLFSMLFSRFFVLFHFSFSLSFFPFFFPSFSFAFSFLGCSKSFFLTFIAARFLMTFLFEKINFSTVSGGTPLSFPFFFLLFFLSCFQFVLFLFSFFLFLFSSSYTSSSSSSSSAGRAPDSTRGRRVISPPQTLPTPQPTRAG